MEAAQALKTKMAAMDDTCRNMGRASIDRAFRRQGMDDRRRRLDRGHQHALSSTMQFSSPQFSRKLRSDDDKGVARLTPPLASSVPVSLAVGLLQCRKQKSSLNSNQTATTF